ncbi:MAG: hypothetical protein U9R79_01570 [Armatimonadota bacterium]|nr:hypothetical protein [Armatimonadota bacterium]
MFGENALPEEGVTVAIIGLAALLLTWVFVYSLARVSADADAAVERWDSGGSHQTVKRGA